MNQNSPERPAVVVEQHGSEPSVAIVRPLGDLDMLTAPELGSELSARVERHQYVILDLAGVTFLSSGGLQVIVAAHRAAQNRGRVLHVVGAANRIVARPLKITGLDALLVISDVPAPALAAELLDSESPGWPTAGG